VVTITRLEQIYATKAFNTRIHEGMKYAPYELVFGRVARVSISTFPDDKGNKSYSEYATALFNRIFDDHARTLNMQKLDLNNTMTVKQTRRYLTRTIMYIC